MKCFEKLNIQAIHRTLNFEQTQELINFFGGRLKTGNICIRIPLFVAPLWAIKTLQLGTVM